MMEPHTTREFMFDYEPEVRQHWPVSSYRNRPPLTPAEITAIKTNVCDKCGGMLLHEMQYGVYDMGAERGPALKCSSCGKRLFPPDPPNPRTKKPDLRKENLSRHRLTYREFTCKRCGELQKGTFAMWRKFCVECSDIRVKVKNRKNNRMHNNLSRYLGA